MVGIKSGVNNLGNNDIDDVRWLCSLSETELDMLISIKRMAIHRAREIFCDILVRNFDLKTLRSLSSTMMENLKAQLEGHTSIEDVRQQIGESNLFKSHTSASFSSMDEEELWEYIHPGKKRRIKDLFADDKVSRQKQRTFKEAPSHQS